MKLRQYQVDAFSQSVFGGNPAAIVPLESWLSDACMQAIANENNLSETAFFVARDGGFDLRWFTPETEVDLCGHATLATAHVMYECLGYAQPDLHFSTRSGELIVSRQADGKLRMDFPAANPQPVEAPEGLAEALGVEPEEVWFDVDYFCFVENEQNVRSLQPDMTLLKRIKSRGICVTARGDEADFVSRFFGPAAGIDEDPVTGSAHTALAPLWSARLGKPALYAQQLSARGGDVWCELVGNRVRISGYASLFMSAEISVDCD